MSGVNREQVRAPHSGKGWCDGCDAQIVTYNGRKCPRCGARNGRRRGKRKDTPTPESESQGGSE